jgi:hypothetical protein
MSFSASNAANRRALARDARVRGVDEQSRQPRVRRQRHDPLPERRDLPANALSAPASPSNRSAPRAFPLLVARTSRSSAVVCAPRVQREHRSREVDRFTSGNS